MNAVSGDFELEKLRPSPDKVLGDMGPDSIIKYIANHRFTSYIIFTIVKRTITEVFIRSAAPNSLQKTSTRSLQRSLVPS